MLISRSSCPSLVSFLTPKPNVWGHVSADQTLLHPGHHPSNQKKAKVNTRWLSATWLPQSTFALAESAAEPLITLLDFHVCSGNVSPPLQIFQARLSPPPPLLPHLVGLHNSPMDLSKRDLRLLCRPSAIGA